MDAAGRDEGLPAGAARVSGFDAVEGRGTPVAAGFVGSEGPCACLARRMAACHSSCPSLDLSCVSVAGREGAPGAGGGADEVAIRCFARSRAALHSSSSPGVFFGAEITEGEAAAAELCLGADDGGLESLFFACSRAARQASPSDATSRRTTSGGAMRVGSSSPASPAPWGTGTESGGLSVGRALVEHGSGDPLSSAPDEAPTFFVGVSTGSTLSLSPLGHGRMAMAGSESSVSPFASRP